MNPFYHTLPEQTIGNPTHTDLWSDKVALLTQNLQLAGSYTENIGIYISAALFIFALIALAVSIHIRTKSVRMVRQEEQHLSDLFTKATNEIRNPLTVILGMSKQLREQKNLSSSNLSIFLGSIERQGRNLSDLISKLYDVAESSSAKKEAAWKTGDLIVFTEMVVDNFRNVAGEKGIELQYFYSDPVLEVDFIPEYLYKILHQLLDNALKYSSSGSRIRLALEADKRQGKKIVYRITTQGCGITEDELPHIFELFYRCASDRSANSATGNGIGLALVKRLTEAMEGTIEVDSKPGLGTTFTVVLPSRKKEKKRLAPWKPSKKSLQPAHGPSFTENDDTGSMAYEATSSQDPRSTLLLAENNRDIALFIRATFGADQYNIIHVPDGAKAYEIAQKINPDIVISDMAMPRQYGIELCRAIKADPILNHTPVLLITSHDSDSERLESLKCGADGHIHKPFNPEELRLRANNLIKIRQLMKEKYGQPIIKDGKDDVEARKNANAEFLRHVTDIIHREMKNPDFSTGKLARELAISVSQLNKKLNAITGYPSSTYILQVKLNQAKKIFKTQNRTIGEVATECGIYDVNYFSRVFKKQTGVTPSQYKRLPQ